MVSLGVEPPTPSARERILSTAYELFKRRGIRAVGTDEVIARACVAKATLYRHFATKNDLVLAVLERREQLWTHGLIEARQIEPRRPLERGFRECDIEYRQGIGTIRIRRLGRDWLLNHARLAHPTSLSDKPKAA